MRRLSGLIVLWLMLAAMPGLCRAAGTSLEADLQQNLTQIKGIVAQMEANLAAGRATSTSLEKLRPLTEKVRATHLLLLERFAARQAEASGLGPTASSRQRQVGEQYRAAVEEYLDLADALLQQEQPSPATLLPSSHCSHGVSPNWLQPLLSSLPLPQHGRTDTPSSCRASG